jgi:hypothetical protein
MMKLVLVALSVLLSMTASALAQNSDSSDGGIRVISRGEDYDRKWALIVGINYEGAEKVRQLHNAQNDALAIRNLLRVSYGFDCELLLGNEPDQEATRAKISARLRLREKIT